MNRHLMNLILFFSLFAQAGHAQKIKTVEEYKALFDSITPLVKLVEKDSIRYVGKSFSEFVKQLDSHGLKIMQIWLGSDDRKVYPQHLYDVSVRFTTWEEDGFASANYLSRPYILVLFAESKPYKEAEDLFIQYKGSFTEEVAAFYGDAVVQSLYCYCPDDIYFLRKQMELRAKMEQRDREKKE